MNNTPTFGSQFILRHKSKQSEMAGIYLRITVNNQKIEVSTKLQCPKILWDNNKQRVKSDGKFNHHQVNRHIENIKAKILSIYQDLRIKEQLITATTIKNAFIGNTDIGRTLSCIIDYHYITQKDHLNKYTFAHYKTTAKYLRLFLRNKRKVDDIYLKHIDYQFICDYEAFLRAHQPLTSGMKELAHNSIMRHMARLRTYINLAIKLGWIQHYPFKAYPLSYKHGTRKHLTQQQLDTLRFKDFSIKRLQLTKDLFIFSCYTGLAYSDVMQLTPDHILKGIDGNNWIHTTRKKTHNTVRIPLLPVAEQIIFKYKDNPKSVYRNALFPKISNQKLNSYLKEIADVSGIKTNLTFHVARHTFATIVTLSNGVPIETVSKILGHTKITTTQIYAKVLENKISEDMNMLRQKLELNTSNTILKSSI
jgi:site-specific recombinase XerD